MSGSVEEEVKDAALVVLRREFGQAPWPHMVEFDEEEGLWRVSVSVTRPRIVYGEDGLPRDVEYETRHDLGFLYFDEELGFVEEESISVESLSSAIAEVFPDAGEEFV